MAVSFARSMETSERIAAAILLLDDSAWGNPIQSLCDAANAVLQSSTVGRGDSQCLIVSTKPTLRAYFLRAAQIGGYWQPFCQEVIGYAIAGDDNNSAIFWIQRYYKKEPVIALLPLAAQLIVVAGKLNSAAIGGLEIVTCDSGGCRRISDESIAALESAAEEWDKRIRALFSDYAQQFTYAPSVIR
jgi:hypothetical protein